MSYHYYAPFRTMFGYGCSKELGGELKALGIKKPMIVTDPGMVKIGIPAEISSVLSESGIGTLLFDGVQPNPTVANIRAGAAMAKENGCDALISIGGGSAHDCAKGISVSVGDDKDVTKLRGSNRSAKPGLPLIAVTTTAGTGSECTLDYVIVDEETKEKYGNWDVHVMPVLSVEDHALMMKLPPMLTAGTGMDALTHALESYVSMDGFLMTQALAETAVRMIFKYLEAAVKTGDEASREGMAVAQYIAGTSFGNAGCGLVHSMSHQLSALYDLPHGLCNAILMPAASRYNMEHPEACARYAALARTVFAIETAGMSEREQAAYLIDRIEALSEAVGTKLSLKSLGVREEDLPLLAQKTLPDASLRHSYRKPSAEEVEALYRELM